MYIQVNSAEEFLTAIKREVEYLCTPYFLEEYAECWNKDWEDRFLANYSEIMVTEPVELPERCYKYPGIEYFCPDGHPWIIAAVNRAFQFIEPIVNKKYEDVPMPYEVYEHLTYSMIKDWGREELNKAFWDSDEWQKTLKDSYVKYAPRCHHGTSWLRLCADIAELYTLMWRPVN